MDASEILEQCKDYTNCVEGNFSKRAVYDLAGQLGIKYKRDEISNKIIRDIIEDFGGKVHIVDTLRTHEVLGSLFVHAPYNFDILLPSHTSMFRDVFTLAHELGHYLLHTEIGKKPKHQASRYGSGVVEWEANWFAAGFLMPAKTLRSHSDKNAIEIASLFHVSTETANTRLKIFKNDGF